VQLLVLARHGRSQLNLRHLVNGDPSRDEGLSDEGREEARNLGVQIAGVAIDVAIVSPFPRAQETARIALGDRRETPVVVDDGLGDVRIGSLEHKTIADYRAWKRGRSRDDPFPGGGESLNDAARRFAEAYERILHRPERVVFCVCHEIPVRYAVNMVVGSSEFDSPVHDIPNATPYLFDEPALGRVVERMRTLAG
jgi:broad specificity phosphatase PhoE